jgi:hypothetical protein
MLVDGFYHCNSTLACFLIYVTGQVSLLVIQGDVCSEMIKFDS